MAKVVISVDTEDKSLVVSIDGKKVSDVVDTSCYREVDKEGRVVGFYINISTVKDTKNGMQKRVSYWSVGSTRAQKITAAGYGIHNEDLPDFVGIEEESQVHQDIKQFLLGKK